jgi:hypothetical protein
VGKQARPLQNNLGIVVVKIGLEPALLFWDMSIERAEGEEKRE